MVKKALLIGINYIGSQCELNGCINDILNIRKFLVESCGYLETNIKTLTDTGDIYPTKLNIEENITWLISNSSKGDTLFFYYSGHGSYINDISGDESDKKDEVIVPIDYYENGFIVDDWLFSNMISKVPIDVTLWGFTDCCHSGTLLDLQFNYKSISKLKKGSVKRNKYNSNEWIERFILSVEKSKNVIGNINLFSGCQDSQTSADAYLGNSYQGAFTNCLLHVLNNNLKRLPNGTIFFDSKSLKLRNMLKEINCRLCINGFNNQSSQLSLSKQNDFDKYFSP